jgi:methionyl-tRNA formyltransferase
MIRAIFMGSPAFALLPLKSLVSNGYEIVAVYTQADKRGGRGQQPLPSPVKQYAVEHNLTVRQPTSFRDGKEVAFIARLQPDIIVVSAYGKILPDELLTIPKHRCINIHPSLLPQYRGPSPVAAAILKGDTTAGVTIMLIEKRVDSGPILSQEEAPVFDDDTTASLSGRLLTVGADLLVRTIPAWVSGQIQPVRQDDERASYTRMAVKADGKLNFNEPAVQLCRKIRAYYPWPGCYVDWKGKRLRIVKAVPIADQGTGRAGGVIALHNNEAAKIFVRTGDGLLGLVTLQPEGKREMAAADFIAGHRDFIGSVLT